MHVEKPDLTAEESNRLLDRQNAGLASGEWLVVRGSESRDAKSSHYAALIPGRSLNVLKACSLRPHWTGQGEH